VHEPALLESQPWNPHVQKIAVRTTQDSNALLVLVQKEALTHYVSIGDDLLLGVNEIILVLTSSLHLTQRKKRRGDRLLHQRIHEINSSPERVMLNIGRIFDTFEVAGRNVVSTDPWVIDLILTSDLEMAWAGLRIHHLVFVILNQLAGGRSIFWPERSSI